MASKPERADQCERRPLEHRERLLAALLPRVGPYRERLVVATELVRQAPARGLDVHGLARVQGVDDLGADGAGAPHPALALLGLVPDEPAAQRLDVDERPVRPQLDRLDQLGLSAERPRAPSHTSV